MIDFEIIEKEEVEIIITQACYKDGIEFSPTSMNSG
jgi:hypothetical protein